MFRRYRVKLLSRLRTPLQSDTIFGHICWGIKYVFGEERLISFLSAMQQEPLMKISCAFPKDCLPRPVLPSMKREKLREIARNIGTKYGAKNDQEALFIGLSKIKNIRKSQYISFSLWQRLKEAFNEYSLVLALINEKQEKKNTISFVHPHNTISRLTGTVLEGGGLYFERDIWPDPDSDFDFDIYVWFKDERVKSLWDRVWKEYIEPSGFGKDKSTGAGHLRISEDTSFDNSIFYLEETNAWMSLSLLGFNKMPNFSDAYYRLMLKFGKLGGDYAISSPTGGPVNPFKKPLLMFEPGSVFEGKSPPKGALLKEVHQDRRICHYGYGLFLPFKMEH